uniref:Uncharacterized protein n=1 Tax=Oryza sativa subsp. japonica TaxID=39947 RepID=Q688E9_ORYSJ|nr:hypothetical protein [Oryza sativa Japonica Group]
MAVKDRRDSHPYTNNLVENQWWTLRYSTFRRNNRCFVACDIRRFAETTAASWPMCHARRPTLTARLVDALDTDIVYDIHPNVLCAIPIQTTSLKTSGGPSDIRRFAETTAASWPVLWTLRYSTFRQNNRYFVAYVSRPPAYLNGALWTLRYSTFRQNNRYFVAYQRFAKTTATSWPMLWTLRYSTFRQNNRYFVAYQRFAKTTATSWPMLWTLRYSTLRQNNRCFVAYVVDPEIFNVSPKQPLLRGLSTFRQNNRYFVAYVVDPEIFNVSPKQLLLRGLSTFRQKNRYFVAYVVDPEIFDVSPKQPLLRGLCCGPSDIRRFTETTAASWPMLWTLRYSTFRQNNRYFVAYQRFAKTTATSWPTLWTLRYSTFRQNNRYFVAYQRFAKTTATSWPMLWTLRYSTFRQNNRYFVAYQRFAKTTATSWPTLWTLRYSTFRQNNCYFVAYQHFAKKTATSWPMLWTLRYSTFHRNNRCFVAYVVDPQIFDVSPKQPLLRGLCCGPYDIRRFAETTAASWPMLWTLRYSTFRQNNRCFVAYVVDPQIFDVSPKQPLLRGLCCGPYDIRRFAETTAASWPMIFDVSPKQPLLRGRCCGPYDIRRFAETTAASWPMLGTLRYSTFRQNNRCFVAYVVDPQIFDVSPKQPLLRGLCCGPSDIRRFAEPTAASWPMLWTLRYSTFRRTNRCFVAYVVDPQILDVSPYQPLLRGLCNHLVENQLWTLRYSTFRRNNRCFVAYVVDPQIFDVSPKQPLLRGLCCGPSDIRRFAETTAASWPMLWTLRYSTFRRNNRCFVAYVVDPQIFDVLPKQPLLRGLCCGPSDIRRFDETTAASWPMLWTLRYSTFRRNNRYFVAFVVDPQIFDVSPKQPLLRGLCCGPSDIRRFTETTAASWPMLWTLRYSTFRRNNRCFMVYVVDPQIFDVSPKQPLLRGLCCGPSDIRRFAETTAASWPMLWTLRYSTFCRNNRCFVAYVVDPQIFDVSPKQPLLRGLCCGPSDIPRFAETTAASWAMLWTLRYSTFRRNNRCFVGYVVDPQIFDISPKQPLLRSLCCGPLDIRRFAETTAASWPMLWTLRYSTFRRNNRCFVAYVVDPQILDVSPKQPLLRGLCCGPSDIRRFAETTAASWPMLCTLRYSTFRRNNRCFVSYVVDSQIFDVSPKQPLLRGLCCGPSDIQRFAETAAASWSMCHARQPTLTAWLVDALDTDIVKAIHPIVLCAIPILTTSMKISCGPSDIRRFAETTAASWPMNHRPHPRKTGFGEVDPQRFF